MNETPPTVQSDSMIRRTPRVLFVLAILVTIVASFYVEENLRGRWTWHKVKARWQVTEWAAVIPPPVPDEQNFAATPFFRSLFPTAPDPIPGWPKDFNEASGRISHIQKQLHRTHPQPNRKERQPTDLAAWDLAFQQVGLGTSKLQIPANAAEAGAQIQAAAAVLKDLAPYEPVLNELRRVGQRPYSRFPIQYDNENPVMLLLPHLARLREVCRLLQVRAAAQLAQGQPAEALEDLQLMLRLADAPRDEPLLISHLVRLAMLRCASDVVWEGIWRRKWSDGQLQFIQAGFESANLLPEYTRTLKAECAMGLKFIQLVRDKAFTRYDLINSAGELQDAASGQKRRQHQWQNAGLLLFPKGWLDMEQAQYARLLYQNHVEVVSEGGINVQQCRGANSELRKGGAIGAFVHHRVLTSMLVPALERVASRTAEGQTVNNQTAIACALERYRLANGKLPAGLEELVPKFIQRLPADVVAKGSPLKYQRLGDTDFMIYSVGWDQHDDGGLVESSSDKPQDWVWRSTPALDGP